ncbi:MAG TPA: hypothetical protein PKK84_06995 [Armatimonadota bacterium]|nr:hypothetical protein [Armatimonadota bacterium]
MDLSPKPSEKPEFPTERLQRVFDRFRTAVISACALHNPTLTQMGVALDSIQFRLREWSALADICVAEPVQRESVGSGAMAHWPVTVSKPLYDQLAFLVEHPDQALRILSDRSPESVFALLDAARREVTRMIYQSELTT